MNHLHHYQGMMISTSTDQTCGSVINRNGKARFSYSRCISWLIRAARPHSHVVKRQCITMQKLNVESHQSQVPGKVIVKSLRLINNPVKRSAKHNCQFCADVWLMLMQTSLWRESQVLEVERKSLDSHVIGCSQGNWMYDYLLQKILNELPQIGTRRADLQLREPTHDRFNN